MTDFAQISKEASLLAQMAKSQNFASSAKGRVEKIWHYHTYEGSTPASSIDWHQSARTEVPLNRTPEATRTAPLYLWVDWNVPNAIESLAPVFLAHATLNMKEESPVSWLGEGNAPTLQKDHFSLLYQRAIEEHLFTPSPYSLHRAEIILAAPFHQDPKGWKEIITAFHRQGCMLSVLPLQEDPSTTISQLCKNLAIPSGAPIPPHLDKTAQIALLATLARLQKQAA